MMRVGPELSLAYLRLASSDDATERGEVVREVESGLPHRRSPSRDENVIKGTRLISRSFAARAGVMDTPLTLS
jgi:hypothetical protein